MNYRCALFVASLPVLSNAVWCTASPANVYSYRAKDIEKLREGFTSPPREAGPWVYWFWFDNVVQREGDICQNSAGLSALIPGILIGDITDNREIIKLKRALN